MTVKGDEKRHLSWRGKRNSCLWAGSSIQRRKEGRGLLPLPHCLLAPALPHLCLTPIYLNMAERMKKKGGRRLIIIFYGTVT